MEKVSRRFHSTMEFSYESTSLFTGRDLESRGETAGKEFSLVKATSVDLKPDRGAIRGKKERHQ